MTHEYDGPEKEGLLKFDSKVEAQEYNNQIAKGHGCRCITKYWFPCVELDETTTLTKSEYAALMGIAETVAFEDGGELESNPAFEALENSYTVNKAVLINSDEVRDQYAQQEGDGNV